MNLGTGQGGAGSAGFGGFSSAFGATTAAYGSTPSFGAVSATPTFGTTTTTFGGPSPSAPTTAFGSATTTPAAVGALSGLGRSSSAAFSAPSTLGTTTAFGAPAPSTAFGSTTAFGAAPATTFGTTATQSASSTASSGFGAFGTSTSAPTAPFGTTTTTFGSSTAPSFGSLSATPFGSGAAPTTTFGSTPSIVPFGSAAPTTAFGSTSNLLGGAPAAAPTFGNAAAAAAPTTAFGGASTVFGATSASTPFSTSAPPTFGQPAPATVGNTTFPSGSAAPSAFGTAAPTTTTLGSSTSFGNAAPTRATVFGSTKPGSTTLGSETAIGKPAPTSTFGSSAPTSTVFGSSTAAPSITFGNASAPTTTFGATATAFGNSSPLTPTFGFASAAPSTTFGSAKPATTSFGNAAPGAASTTVFGRASPAPTTTASFGRSSTTLFGKAASSGKSSWDGPATLLDVRSSGAKPPRQPRQLPAVSLKTAAPLPSPDTSPTNDRSKAPRSAADDGDMTNDVEKFDLSTAVTIEGLCIDMCSSKEREEQIRCDDLSTFEKGSPPEAFIIKRYQRSAADHKLDIPSEIRPLGVLRRTQLYLEQNIIDLDKYGPDPRFNPPRVPDILDLYNFFWNRARMIRNDFTLQNYRGGGRHHVIAMDVHERIARFFILCEHELIENPKFIEQQNMEQLGKTMKSLQDFYDDARLHGDESSPFEAEFAGYFILLHLDKDKASAVLKFTKNLPRSLLHSSFVEFAMAAFVARHTNDYVTFFRLVQRASLLQACLLHRYFPSVRSDALGCMNRVYRHPYPLDSLTTLLCFDSPAHAAAICDLHGLPTSPDGAGVVMGGDSFKSDAELRANNIRIPISCSEVYVSAKQHDWLRRDVCRGVTEYGDGAYPVLPKTIQTTEADERRRLYPSRPAYEDPFSNFDGNATAKGPHETALKKQPGPVPWQPPLPPAVPSPRVTPPLAPLPGQPPLPQASPGKATVTTCGRSGVVGSAPATPPKHIPSLTEIEERQKQLQQEKQRLLQEIAKRKSTKAAAAPPKSPAVPAITPTKQPPPLKVAKEAAATPRVTVAAPPATTRANEPVSADAAATQAAEKAAAMAAEKQRAADAKAKQARQEAEEKKKRQREQLEWNKQLAEKQRQADEAAKAREIQKFGQTWLAIHFEARDRVVARAEALDSQERDALRQVQRLAVQKLRFAMWRRFVQQQKHPRIPGNAVFRPSVGRSPAARVGDPLESFLSHCPRPVPPPWTAKDATATDACSLAIAGLQRQLHAPVNAAALLASRLCQRHPTDTTVEYSIGLMSVASTDEAAALDVMPWLAAKCGVVTPLATPVVHRVHDPHTNHAFILHLSSFPASTAPCAIWTAVAFHSVDQVRPWVRRVVAEVVGAALPTAPSVDVHLLALTTLPAQTVQSAAATELDAMPAQVHVAWHVGSWDTAHDTVTLLLEHMGAEAELHPHLNAVVSLRDTIDDVIRITLHQSSVLTTHFSDVVAHLHDALQLLHRLIEAAGRTDPLQHSSRTIMEAFLQAVPAPASQSTVAWIQSLPTLPPSQRDLALHLVDAAWQHQEDGASPAKTIVATVFAVVLNGIPGMDDAVVTLPKAWVVECRALLQSIASDTSLLCPTQRKSKRRVDEDLSTKALVSMMLQSRQTKKRVAPTTPRRTRAGDATTRQALHAKWKQSAARQRAVHALDREKAAHATYRRVLHASLES